MTKMKAAVDPAVIRSGADPAKLVFEITETALIRNQSAGPRLRRARPRDWMRSRAQDRRNQAIPTIAPERT
jgi:hypothetical protein